MDVPTIWILSHRRAGDRDQMLALARALDWPATLKRISFRLPKLAAIPFLARRLFDPARSDPLDPPWPDLVLCAEGRASAVARLVKARSQGAVKTVCLGRPAGSPANFDLVLTTPQYRLAAGANVVELALPLPPEVRASGDADPGLSAYPRPLTAVLVGGTSLPERLDRDAAAGLAAEMVRHTTRGTLVFVTSPRTDAGAAAALAQAVPPPHVVHLWRRDDENPYWQVVTAADHVVVTSDSVSMVMDAFAAGKPVSVYPLPQHRTVRNRLVNWLHGRKSAAWLFDHGILEVRPDRRLLFDKLAAQGRLTWFGKPATGPAAPDPVDETAIAVAKVRQLFADPLLRT
jgi:mitochondrial fission protein ELM1